MTWMDPIMKSHQRDQQLTKHSILRLDSQLDPRSCGEELLRAWREVSGSISHFDSKFEYLLVMGVQTDTASTRSSPKSILVVFPIVD